MAKKAKKPAYPHLERTESGISVALTNDWYEEDQGMFEAGSIEIPQGKPLCLVGCNGSGKSTAIEQIRQTIHEELGARDAANEREFNPMAGVFRRDDSTAGAYYVSFDRSANFVLADDGSSWISRSDMDWFLGMMASNGEGLIHKLNGAIAAIRIFSARAAEAGVPFFLFLDDADAGTSIDVASEVREAILDLSAKMGAAGAEHYIVIASNSFELARGLDCVYVRDMSRMRFDDYETYKAFVLKTREAKERRDGIKK